MYICVSPAQTKLGGRKWKTKNGVQGNKPQKQATTQPMMSKVETEAKHTSRKVNASQQPNTLEVIMN